MKYVWIIHKVRYDSFLPSETIVGMFEDKKQAYERWRDLKLNNKEPVEKDAYGPLGGVNFYLIKRKLDDV